jgi:hypothetical protein
MLRHRRPSLRRVSFGVRSVLEVLVVGREYA